MKLNYDKFHEQLLAAGMHPTRAREMTKQVRQDMLDWPALYQDWETCRSMLERGFLPGRKMLFGSAFNEQTWQDYYPDFDYFMAHPINNHFSFWINDKLTLKYILNAPEVSRYVPEFYLYIENDGRYSYLMDIPENVERGPDFLLNLLKEKKHLALKPNHGAGGKGFFGLRYRDGQILMNEQPITREEFEALKPSLNGYIVTEFIEQSREMEKVFPGTDCALRIILYKKPQLRPEDTMEYDCLIAYARFGSDRSNSASNLCHGGLAVRIDWETGTYQGNFRGNAEFWGPGGAEGFAAHPDTGIPIDGEKIPHWERIRDGLLKICSYMSSLDFFGMDVIVTEEDFMLCEINSAPSTGLGQFHFGKACLDNPSAKQFAQSKRRPAKKTLLECFMAAMEPDAPEA